jgi:hypothetical protein
MDASFRKVAKFPSAFLAHLVAGRLEAEGIAAFPVDDHVEGNPAGTDLFVAREHAARALEVLGSMDAEEEAQGAVEEEEPGAWEEDPPEEEAPAPSDPPRATLRCPSCGSTDVEEEPRFLPLLPARRRCLRCRTPIR